MFGQNDQNDNQTGDTNPTPNPTDNQASPPSAPADAPVTNAPILPPEDTDQPADDAPLLEETGTPDKPQEPVQTPDFSATSPASSSDEPADEVADELLSLKKTAVEELTPLLEHLDQSPEEKFKTTMMLIQATDSANLVKVAHDAAKEISDEKVRAQALLDIVNEINYFTHGKGEDEDHPTAA